MVRYLLQDPCGEPAGEGTFPPATTTSGAPAAIVLGRTVYLRHQAADQVEPGAPLVYRAAPAYWVP